MTAARTRFAPTPNGYLHLGHVANAIFVWGLGRARDATILLRIEDHDRQRSRPAFVAAAIEDLAWLGFEPDGGPVRQSGDDAPYVDALEHLRAEGRTYGCDCARSTFAAWARAHGHPWRGPGCPGRCRERGVAGPILRRAIGDGTEAWEDLLLGTRSGDVTPSADPPVRDRHGDWTYGFSVVVDDLRQGIDLVIRGQDLVGETPAQIRTAALLGRSAPPTFAHHGLIRRPDGHKLSKSAGDTGVRELRASGQRPQDVIGLAASLVGLQAVPTPLDADEVASLFGA